MRCPTCEKRFPTEQGMRQHHTKVHGNPLPNRTCSGCGLEFYDPKSRRRYCSECNPNAGSNNGNWRDATEEASCRCCGTTFEYYPSNKDGVYCSSCVEAADGLLPENPSKPGERVSVDCGWCDTTLSVYSSRLEANERGVFCDCRVTDSGFHRPSSARIITSGPVARSRTDGRGGRYGDRPSNATTIDVERADVLETTSDETRTFTTLSL